jgi:hypothetical protein
VGGGVKIISPLSPPLFGGGGGGGATPPPPRPPGGGGGQEVGYAAFIGRFAYAEGINM